MGVMRDVKREEGAAYGVLGVVLALILVNGKVLADGACLLFLLPLLRSVPLVSLSFPSFLSTDTDSFLIPSSPQIN